MLDITPLDPTFALDSAAAEYLGWPCLDAETGRLFARRLSSAFRRHPHVNNVLTHVGLGRWGRIEEALIALLTVPTDIVLESPLERNVLDLIWTERGITGRIMKPLFLNACRASLPPVVAERCIAGIAALSFRASASDCE